MNSRIRHTDLLASSEEIDSKESEASYFVQPSRKSCAALRNIAIAFATSGIEQIYYSKSTDIVYFHRRDIAQRVSPRSA
jgi:hypothetical protein